MSDSQNKHFWIRKLHSLSGLVPIGGFVCFHLWSNSTSRHGQKAYNNMVHSIHEMNYLVFMEIFIIALPLLFHAIYGLVIWWQSQNVVTGNAPNYSWTSNWLYVLQRLTGGIAFLYIITHVWSTRVQVILNPALQQDLFTHMQNQLSNPLWLIWYLVGTTAAAFHFANGLRLMGLTWGVTIGERSQRWATAFAGIVFVSLTALGIQGLIGFGVFGRIFGA